MKTIEEILNSGAVMNAKVMPVNGITVLAGQIYDRKQRINFTLGTNEDGWEHVAISVGGGRRIPTWDVMCKAKRTFWNDFEDVVQLHPKETQFFHGFPKEMEVLHLWRPADGDWSLLNEMFQEGRT